MRIAITGGTGFVGGHLAAALSAAGHEAVVVARGVDRRPWALEVQALPRVFFVRASLDDQAELERAFAGCSAVAHCAGINREIGAATYEAVHVRGTANVVRAAERAGVQRVALVSFLRARPDCGSPYHESKWAAEEIVRSSNLDWTVLKPGMMFGRGDHMLDHLSRTLLTFPVYVGIGQRRVRPLAIEDAVDVMVAALVNSALSHKTVPIVGPSELGFDDAARLVAQVIGKRRLFVRAPISFHYLLARVAEFLMSVPLVATAQVRILEEELVEPTLGPDELPPDLMPQIRFDQDAVRAGLPTHPERFGLRDLRPFAHSGARFVLCGEGRTMIRREPKDILEFVLNVEQYRRADRKIGRVHWVRRAGYTGEVRHGGRFLGIPAPAVTLAFELTPNERLDFKGTSMPWPLKGFDGFFTCERCTDGTDVVHRECFILGPIVGPLFKILFGAWLSRDTAAEVLRMKRVLESERSSSSVA